MEPLDLLLEAIREGGGKKLIADLALELDWGWTDTYCRVQALDYEGLVSWNGHGADPPQLTDAT